MKGIARLYPSGFWKLDARSLALFRICLAAMVLSFDAEVAPNFTAFYGSSSFRLGIALCVYGVLPASAMLLALGFHTWKSNLLCWIALCFVQKADPFILHGGDAVLRLSLFWAIFLPTGVMWSLDARRLKTPNPAFQAPMASYLAGIGFFMQTAYLYIFASLLKQDPLWAVNGNALFFALQIEHLATPLGRDCLQYPDFLRLLTFATRHLEFFGPLLLLVPWHYKVIRFATTIVFLFFHLLGIQLLFLLGSFPWACAVLWMPFVPDFFWNFLGKNHREAARAAPLPRRLSFFDGAVCGLILFSMVMITAWNVANVWGNLGNAWMTRHDFSRHVLHLDQRWNMFAPPPAKHGWFLAPATLSDGTRMDLFTGESVTLGKPRDIAASQGSHRWRIYLYKLCHDHDSKQTVQFEHFLIQRWNSAHPSRVVVDLSLVWMMEKTNPDLTVSPAIPIVFDSCDGHEEKIKGVPEAVLPSR